MGQALDSRVDKPDTDSEGWDAYSCCRNYWGLGLGVGKDILSEVVSEVGEETWRLGEEGGCGRVTAVAKATPSSSCDNQKCVPGDMVVQAQKQRPRVLLKAPQGRRRQVVGTHGGELKLRPLHTHKKTEKTKTRTLKATRFVKG